MLRTSQNTNIIGRRQMQAPAPVNKRRVLSFRVLDPDPGSSDFFFAYLSDPYIEIGTPSLEVFAQEIPASAPPQLLNN
jgi:hypothetical protein